MGIASELAAQAEPFGLRQDFRTVGAPALLVTNEITPAGFYSEVGERFALDGYVFGPGCGNVLSVVEAFASAPRGLVLVDVATRPWSGPGASWSPPWRATSRPKLSWTPCSARARSRSAGSPRRCSPPRPCPNDAALRVSFHVSHKAAEAPEETDARLGR